MLLSVIIPTFKRREALSVCLKHLTPENQNLSPDIFEVIVTDDAPDNDTHDSLSRDYPWVLHNRGPQKGPASNRNSGAKSARGEWLIFLDDDCLPQPTFLSAYIEAIHKNPDYFVFEGCTLAERPRMRLDEEAPINDHGGYLWSCNFLINRKLFREQLKKRDVKFLFEPKASVVHPWRSLSANDRYLKMRLTSHAIFLNRYPQWRPSFYRTCKSILRGWIRGLFVEAPGLKFRGFWRYFSRQLTITQYQFLIWSEFSRKQPGN
jgi:glycosyltransferase involved in cell wall biosynthesis